MWRASVGWPHLLLAWRSVRGEERMVLPVRTRDERLSAITQVLRPLEP